MGLGLLFFPVFGIGSLVGTFPILGALIFKIFRTLLLGVVL